MQASLHFRSTLPGHRAAARLRNLSRAADSLHLTVSALSHQIRGLEERVGRLFVRAARGLQEARCYAESEAAPPAGRALRRQPRRTRRKRRGSGLG